MHRSVRFLLSCLFFMLLSTPAFAQVGFGGSVAVDGDAVLIGESGNRFTPGYVYVYRNDGGWTEAGRLAASDGQGTDGFGEALALDGDLLAVTATGGEAGAVYLFSRNGKGWAEIGKLGGDDAARGDAFGDSVALHGDLMVVGAPRQAEGRGATYVFHKGDDGWVQTAKLLPDEPAPAAPNDEAETAEEGAEAAAEEAPRPERVFFGDIVALHQDWLLIGAPLENGTGSVYVYRRGEDGFEKVAKLGEDGESRDAFGSSLAVVDGLLHVGATGANGTGEVKLFKLDADAGVWNPVGVLRPYDAGNNARFGSAIVASGSALLVSAPFADGYEGRIYVFEGSEAAGYTGVSKLGTSNVRGFGGFASAMAASDETLVVGIPGDDFGAGTALIMTRSLGGWDRTKVLSEVTSFAPITGHTVECADGMVGQFPCRGVDLLSYLPMPAIGGPRGAVTNDIWGWTDPEAGRDYVMVGITDRTSFVDVTDPHNPVFLGVLKMTDGARASVWRDIKVYADHAFIVSDAAGEHGMQVFDLTKLRQFSGTPIEFTEDAHYAGIHSAHNIVINEQSAFAFAVGASGGGETCGGGLHMINIEDPRNPVFAGCFSDSRTGRRGTGYSHDAQCVTYHGPDERYQGHEICLGSNETALSIADVTDKRNPVAVGMASYPNVSYSHQGWLTEDHRYFYMNDEGDEGAGLVSGTRTIIWDVQDLEDPIVAGEFIADVGSTDHNLYVVDNVLYESNYDSGLRVFDITDPENIKPIGYVDTVPFGKDGEDGGGSWSNYPYFKSGVVVVTSMNEGLFLVKLRDDARPPADGGSEE